MTPADPIPPPVTPQCRQHRRGKWSLRKRRSIDATARLFDLGWVIATRNRRIELHHTASTRAYDSSMVMFGTRREAAKIARLLKDALDV